MDPNAPEQPAPPTNPEPPAPQTPPEPAPSPEQPQPVVSAVPEQPSPIARQFGEPEAAAAPATAPGGQAASEGKLPSAFSLFKPSWEAVKRNLKAFVLIGLVPYVLIVLLALALGISRGVLHEQSSSLKPELGIGLVVFVLIAAVCALVLTPALVYTQLQSVRGNSVEPAAAVKTGLHTCWRFLGVGLLSGLVIALGFVALIVPGIIFLRRYFLAGYFLIDGDLGVMEAMKRSAAATKGRAMAVWGLVGVLFLIGLVGIIPLLGSIASAVLSVVYYCAPAVRYAQLTGQPVARAAELPQA